MRPPARRRWRRRADALEAPTSELCSEASVADSALAYWGLGVRANALTAFSRSVAAICAHSPAAALVAVLCATQAIVTTPPLLGTAYSVSAPASPCTERLL